MPTAGSPAPTPPADGQEPQQEASATTRLLKAQAAELAALRRRVEGLPEPEQLAELMREVGWQFVSYRLHSLGAVAIHVGARV